MKNKILEEAEEEFFQKGFVNASVRQIAKRAGTIIGNLYHYYPGKEALFEALVESEYNGFIQLLNHHGHMEDTEFLKTPDIALWRQMLMQFMEGLTPIFTRRFYILINGSGGTRFEDARHQFLGFMRAHFLEHFESFHAECPKEMGELLAEQMLEGLLSAIKKYGDNQVMLRTIITELLLFYIVGVMGILQGSEGHVEG